MVTPIMPIEVQDGAPAPLDAMTIAAMQRQQFHEKILRLRALREASEANTTNDKKSRGENKPSVRNGTGEKPNRRPEIQESTAAEMARQEPRKAARP